jgi:hypothetical protein
MRAQKKVLELDLAHGEFLRGVSGTAFPTFNGVVGGYVEQLVFTTSHGRRLVVGESSRGREFCFKTGRIEGFEGSYDQELLNMSVFYREDVDDVERR